MDNKKITAATLVSTPSLTSWSQAYAAGNLFAALSLTSTSTGSETVPPLATIGKEILNTLEAEYFTLETKDLASIEEALRISIKHATEKDNILLSACVASITDGVLYVFAIGGGKAYMKRNKTLGLLLAGKETSSIETVSGFLEDTDIVILETAQFAETITKEKLALAIDNQNPFDIAENLSPILHEQEKPHASAVVFSYLKPEKTEEKIQDEDEIQPPTGTLEQPTETPKPNPIKILLSLATKAASHIPRLPKPNLTGKRKLFLVVTLFLITLLIFGIVFTTKQKQTAAQAALFQEVFSAAQKKYDEGQSLSGLNKNLARDDFTEAQKIITDKKEAFVNDKIHKDKLDALLKNIDDGLSVVSGVNRVNAKTAGNDKSLLLATAIANSPEAISQDDKTIYTINQNEIAAIDKSTKKKKTLVQNKDNWKTVGGLGAYIGNLYVLDRDAGQISKFVDTNQSNYLSSKQDLSKATSIAIDGSIWILNSLGSIQKWTRGKQDSFAVSGIDIQLKNPTRISTDADTDNVYILDNGNNRIVVLNKKGEYQTQYQTDVIKTATEFDVLEKDKKIFVLSSGKIWEIDLSSN